MTSLKQYKIIIIIDGYKFDVTEFAQDHPGGIKILRKYHNKDATKAFNEVKGHCESVVLDAMDKYCIGKTEKLLRNDYY